MCGFVIIGNYSDTAINSIQRDAFQNALVADSARGMDGTGIIRVMREGQATWVKAAGNPFDLFRTTNFVADFWTPITTGWTRWLIGHNRYKTRGDASNKNAHPFQHGHILLAHNGTLRGGNIPEIGKYDVDSEAICKSISERGIDETLQRIDSAYCFVYFDSNEKTLNIIRNKERPMYLGVNEKTSLIALASEETLIDWALMRNGQYIETYKELKENVLYSWTMDNIVPTERTISGWKKKKDKQHKGKKRYMWVNGEEWVDTDGSGVYQKTSQILETLPLATDKTSANNYEMYPQKPYHYSPPAYTTPYTPHTALCKCIQCKPLFPTVVSNPTTKNKMFPTESYLGLKKGYMVTFKLDDYDELTKTAEDSSLGKAYQLTGYSDLYKEFVFKTRIKGDETLSSLLESDYISGKITSILINKDPGAAYTGVVYLTFPEPGWDSIKAPLEIPDHAFTKLHEGE